jgi:hypothetical protein
VKNKSPKFPFPAPIELAKLAAILRPESEPASALKKAMEFYTEALLFHRDLPSKLEELVEQFGSDEQRKAIQTKALNVLLDVSRGAAEVSGKPIQSGELRRLLPKRAFPPPPVEAKCLRHFPEKQNDDPARKYLHEQLHEANMLFKKPTTLLGYIREKWSSLRPAWLASLPEGSVTRPSEWLAIADECIEAGKRTENGMEVYDIPKAVLDGVVEHRRETKRKSWHKSHAEKRRKKFRRAKSQKSSV